MIVLRSRFSRRRPPPCNRGGPPLSCGHERHRPPRRVRRQDRADRCPDAAIAQVRRATLDTLGVMLAGAAEPAAPQRARRRSRRGRHAAVHGRRHLAAGGADLGRPRQRHRRPRPRLRRHELRAPGSSERALLAAALASAEAETTDGAAIVLGYLIGFEVSVALGRRAQSRPLQAGLARHGDHRHARVRRRRRAHPGTRRRADPSRARRRRLARLRPQGELRLDDQAVPRGSRRPQRRLRRDARPRRPHRLRHGARGPAGSRRRVLPEDAGRRRLRCDSASAGSCWPPASP